MMKNSLFILLFSANCLFGQEFSAFKKAYFLDGEDTLNYRILYPKDFAADKKYPVVLFLHGRGESGNDNEKQLTHGAKLFLTDSIRTKFPCIVIFPQCAGNSYWSNVQIDVFNGKRFFTFLKNGKPAKAMSMVLKFTDYFFKQPIVDQSRIYVGGLSMGACGTYEILRRKPKTFAAAFAICGGDLQTNVWAYKNVPLWIFHGGLDDVISPQFSFWIYKALTNVGGKPKFTLYPNANHNSWDKAFAEPDLLLWLFGQQRNNCSGF